MTKTIEGPLASEATIRDYFAMNIMNSLIQVTGKKVFDWNGPAMANEVLYAFRIADAMLHQRSLTTNFKPSNPGDATDTDDDDDDNYGY